jgi:hypothetical protein
MRKGQTREAIDAFEHALSAYRTLIARDPDDIQSRVSSVVPLWRLGKLKAKNGRRDLENALGILKTVAQAGRLDSRRRQWIPVIEAEIAALNN